MRLREGESYVHIDTNTTVFPPTCGTHRFTSLSRLSANDDPAVSDNRADSCSDSSGGSRPTGSVVGTGVLLAWAKTDELQKSEAERNVCNVGRSAVTPSFTS
jgi:hypothetical protein